jgi:hypothetical protein
MLASHSATPPGFRQFAAGALIRMPDVTGSETLPV